MVLQPFLDVLLIIFASPFWVWTCVTGCPTSITIDIQYLWKAWDINSP